MDNLLILKVTSVFAFFMFCGAVALDSPTQTEYVIRTITYNDDFIAEVKTLHHAVFNDGIRYVVQLKPLNSDNWITMDFDQSYEPFLRDNLDCWGDFDIYYNDCHSKSCPLGVDGWIDLENSNIFSCG